MKTSSNCEIQFGHLVSKHDGLLNWQALTDVLAEIIVWRAADLPLARKMIWCFSDRLKTIERNTANTIYKSALPGLRDYYIGRFGNCTNQVRKLKKPT